MLELIITCDDLGICKQRDLGIYKCITEGVATAASIMANGESAKTAVKLFSDNKKNIGLHLNLTEGYPISNPTQIQTLLNEKGMFLGKDGFRKALDENKININEVVYEITAQIKWFKTHFKQVPIYVDSHQHVHVLPQLYKNIADILVTYSIKCVRIPGGHFHLLNTLCKACSIVSQHATNARIEYMKRGLVSPDIFVGLQFCGSSYTAQQLIDILKNIIETPNIPNCVIEIMTHPGFRGNTWDTFNCAIDRELEMNVLCSKELYDKINEMPIRLTSYSNSQLLLLQLLHV